MSLFSMPEPVPVGEQHFRATVEDHRIITFEFTVFPEDAADPDEVAKDAALLYLGGDPGDARLTRVVAIEPTLA